MSATEAPAAPAQPSRVKAAIWAFLNLAVLWTFAVAQPLFDLLKDNPEFFAARGSTGFDIVSFSVLLVVLPPLVLLAVELVIGLAGEVPRRVVHSVFIAVLVALIAAQALKKTIDASDVVLIVLSVAIGAALAFLWWRAELVRSFLNVLSPAPLVFLLLFLFNGSISELAFPNEAQARSIGGVARVPIVVVLFDELPTNTIVDSKGDLDRQRFPGFAELADSSTWFPNAYTVYDSTERAQPAIMDGNLPELDKQPISGDHPNSIFSLLGKTHRMNVSEEATSVCSRDLCEDVRQEESYGGRISSMTEDLGLVWLHVVAPPGIESNLTSVSDNWGNFGQETTDEPSLIDQESSIVGRETRRNLSGGRAIRFADWLERIRPGERPQLSFKHTLLPHVPWQYLPDGTRYQRQPTDPIEGIRNQSYNDPGQLHVQLQRHILQTMYADSLLTGLWRKLKAEGIWDEALIVVAADHGLSFSPRFERRRLDREHAAEIAPIPLFIKAPGQKRPKVDDAYVETIDILPTIFDVLDLDPRVKMDGKSAYSDEVQNRDELRFLIRNTFDELRIPASEYEAERRAIIDRNQRLFGSGADDFDRLFRIGPNQELIGKPASAAGPPLDVDFVYGDEYERVRPESGYVPAYVVARVNGPDQHPRDIAIAVNGRIVAVGNTFRLIEGEQSELVSVMVPPDSFRPGRNEVQVLEVG